MKRHYPIFNEQAFKQKEKSELARYLELCGLNSYVLPGNKIVAEKDLDKYVEELKKPVVKEKPKKAIRKAKVKKYSV